MYDVCTVWSVWWGVDEKVNLSAVWGTLCCSCSDGDFGVINMVSITGISSYSEAKIFAARQVVWHFDEGASLLQKSTSIPMLLGHRDLFKMITNIKNFINRSKTDGGRRKLICRLYAIISSKKPAECITICNLINALLHYIVF